MKFYLKILINRIYLFCPFWCGGDVGERTSAQRVCPGYLDR